MATKTRAPTDRVRASLWMAWKFFLGNWVFAFNGWGNPQPLTAGLWSVAVEEQFYFSWPGLLQWTPRRRLPWVCGGLIVVALVTRGVIARRAPGYSPAMWCNTLARLDPIAMGALVALPVDGPGRRWSLPSWMQLAILVVSALIVVGAKVAISSLVVTLFVVALALGCAVLATVLAPRDGPLAHPALVYLGRISYGLYVYHFPSLWLAEERLGLRWWVYRVSLEAAVTLGCAICSYHFFEQPFLRLKTRFTYVNSAPT